MKYLVIKYFDTFPQEKFYFDTKEEAVVFAEEHNKISNIYEYIYRGKIMEENNE